MEYKFRFRGTNIYFSGKFSFQEIKKPLSEVERG